jgi:polysaccharide biosynthesis/export protein
MLAITATVSISSCRSPKEFTYLQNVSKNQHISGVSDEIKEYNIKPYDNLYVSIKTLNPEVNQLFEGNTAVAGLQAGTDQMYGTNVSQYINGYQVNSLGTISLPILGVIEVEGLTINQISEKIQKKSLEYLKDPIIKVKLLSFKINVDGEVKNPGVYYSYNERTNILEAISMANGVTDNANVKKVMVVRQTKNGSDTYYINLADKALFTSNVYYLQPNDLIYIRPGGNKKLELNTTSYSLFLTTITTILLTLLQIKNL